MKISIIIPVYNCESYIRDSLNSIKNQIYKEIELVIINDGSTDNSKEVINNWIKENKSIKVVFETQVNLGVSSARNHGLQLATGDYIMFCDADDIIHPLMIKTFADTLKENKVETVGCTFTHNPKEYKSLSISKPKICDIKELFLFKNSLFTFCGFIYKRTIINKFGIKFSEDLKFGEDEEFTWKYLCHISKSAFINSPFYYYRINEHSATHKKKDYNRTQVIDSILRVSSYYKQYSNNFNYKIKTYGIPRAKLAILKEFASCNDFDLYRKLQSSQVYKCNMFYVLKFPSVKEKLAVLIYTISPLLFYSIFAINKKR